MLGFKVFLKLIAWVFHSMAVLYSQTCTPSVLKNLYVLFSVFSFFSYNSKPHTNIIWWAFFPISVVLWKYSNLTVANSLSPMLITNAIPFIAVFSGTRTTSPLIALMFHRRHKNPQNYTDSSTDLILNRSTSENKWIWVLQNVFINAVYCSF